MDKKMKFVIVGAGYVGLSFAILLNKNHDVTITDISFDKLEKINKKLSPIQEIEFEEAIKNSTIKTCNIENANNVYEKADYIIIALPTDLDENTGQLNTNIVENTINKIVSTNTKALIVLKSTLPIGFTESIQNKYPNHNFIFSPEFLKEGTALKDQFNASRIVIGYDTKQEVKTKPIINEYIGTVLKCISNNPNVYTMKYSEAEASKLFSNTYLAMRVAFFNELDTLAEVNGFNSQNIIEAICADERIGNHYNNPSFGYGGYCLPKDSKQLLKHYNNIPNSLTGAIVESNEKRMDAITNKIFEKFESINTSEEKILGIYRLKMKANSNDLRSSAIYSILERIKNKHIKIVIYEPLLNNNATINDFEIIEDLEQFKKMCHLIVANRKDSNLDDVHEKVYTRDIYSNN